MEKQHQSRSRGRRMSMPRGRRYVNDFVSFCRRIPTQAIYRDCNIADVSALRRNTDPKIGWSAVMMRAYAVMASTRPWLQRCFMKYPWGHLYEHPSQVCRFAVAREVDGEERLFFARIRDPDRMSLEQIQQAVNEFATKDVSEIPMFRRQMRLAYFPTLLRRLIGWSMLHLSGKLRTRLFGTMGLTTLSAKNTVSVHPPSIGNMVVTYGPVAENGDVRITFVYDHRVFDGGIVADCLAAIEDELNSTLVAELEQLQRLKTLQHTGTG